MSLLSFAILTAPLASASARVSLKTTAAPTKADAKNRSNVSSGEESGRNLFVTPPAAQPAPAPAPLAPVASVTATMAGAITTDADSDTKADPGVDTITYTATITNNTGGDLSGLQFTDTVDTHTKLVAGSTVLAADDSYNTIGNVNISIPDGNTDLLANDSDPDTGDNTGMTATAETKSSTNCAGCSNVTINSDGSFTYDPPVGFTGTDTFTYTANSGGKTTTGTVRIKISGKIWFVKNTVGACTTNCDGRLSHPFTTITTFNTANDGASGHPAAGDYIFLYESGTDYIGPVTLLNNQKLIGQDATASLAGASSITGLTQPSGDTLLPATDSGNATKVNITSASSGMTIGVGNSNTLRGFTVGTTINAKIASGANFGTLTISDVSLTGAGAALDLTSGTLNNSTIDSLSSTSSTNAVKLTTIAGSLTVNGGSVSGATSSAVLVTGGTLSITYKGSVSQANNAALVNISGGHTTGTITFQDGTLSATNGTGLQFSSANGTYNFNGTTTLNGGDAGIDILGDSTGSFNFGTGVAIGNTTSPSGIAFNVDGLSSTSTASVTYSGNITQTNNAALVKVTNHNTGTITFQTGTLSATNGTGLQFSNADSTTSYNFNGTTTLSGGDAGIDITGDSGGTFSFSSNTSITNPTGDAFTVNASTPSVTYSGNITKNSPANTSGALVSITDQASGTITFQTGTLSSTSTSSTATGIQLTDADGTVNFDGTTTLNGGDAGIDILAGDDATNGSSGTFTFSTNTSITRANSQSGIAFNLSGSDCNVTYSGSMTLGSSTGNMVSIDDHDAGTVTFQTGNLTKGSSTTRGIVIQNSNGGTINFNNPTILITMTSGKAIDLPTNNSGGTVNFAPASGGNGIDLTSTTANTFDAAGGGTITVTGSGNTLSSTTGIALNVQNTTIGSSGLTFQSINAGTAASGPANGIVLNNTGTAAGNGSLTVTGNSAGNCGGVSNPSSAPVIADCTGGTIQKATGTGISLTSTKSPSFTRMYIFDNADNGIKATTTSNPSIISCYIDSNADQTAPDESGLYLLETYGTATITNTWISNSFETDLRIENSNATNGALTANISGMTISNNGASTQAGNLFNFLSTLTSNMTLNLSNSRFVGNRVSGQLTTDGVHADTSGGTAVVNVSSSTFVNNFVGISVTLGGSANSKSMTYDLNGNTVTGSEGSAVNVTALAGHSGDTIAGKVRNNIIGTSGTPNSGSLLGFGMDIDNESIATYTAAITNNTIQEIQKFDGISARQVVSAGTTNVTITGNTIDEIRNVNASNVFAINTFITIAGGTICANIASNTLTNIDPNNFGNGKKIRVRQTAGTFNLTQSAATLSSSNSNVPVETLGTINFSQPACATVTMLDMQGNQRDYLAQTEATQPAPTALATGNAQPAELTAGAESASLNDTLGNWALLSQTSAPTSTTSTESNSAHEQQAAIATTGEGRTWSDIAPVSGTEARASDDGDAVDKGATSQALGYDARINKASYQPVAEESGGIRRRSVSANDIRSSHAKSLRVPKANYSAGAATINVAPVGGCSPSGINNANTAVCVDLPTLHAGDSVTISFQVTVNNLPNLSQTNPAQVSNYGTVAGSFAGSPLNTNTVDTPVDRFHSTTTLNSDNNPANQGDTVTFTATVAFDTAETSPTPATPTAPSGTVDFIDTSNANAVICDDVPLVSGKFTCQTSTLTVGSHNIQAVYSGDGNYNPSTSNTVAQSVVACDNLSTVTKTTDDNSSGTLRYAIGHVCTNGTVNFDAALSDQTIDLTADELLINKNMTITGLGANHLTVRNSTSGGSLQIFRIFNVQLGVTATISGLTIKDGSSATGGGGINNDGTLYLADSAVASNNTTASGGGIQNSGTLVITGSTISNNTGTTGAGGILNLATGSLTIRNSTISNNTSNGGHNTGGGISNNGTVTLINVTVASQLAGGGLLNVAPGTTNLGATIVGGNTGDGSDELTGTFNSLGYNLFKSVPATTVIGGTTTGNKTNVDPKLGALGDNGGPTETHALFASSPAIDAATDFALTTLSAITDDTQTTISVNNASTIPAKVGYTIIIGSEQMVVTAKSGNTLTVTRGANGTTAAAHASGASLYPAFDQRGSGFPRKADSADADATQVVDIGAFELHPDIQNISDQTTDEDTAKDVTFNIGDATGTGSPLIQKVEATSGNTTLVPNANLVISDVAGSDTQRKLTITPAANASGTATITVTVTATNGRTAEDSFVLTVTAVNDAPTVTAGGTLSYTENDAATVIDNTITVSDVDSASLASATVQITGNYQSSEDVLSFANTATITGSFDSSTGTLTLTGSDTKANYQTALRSVKYRNTSDNPSTAARTVSWAASDGSDSSGTATSTINITAVNDAPVATDDASYSTNEDTALSKNAANGVLANDTDADTAHSSLTATLVAGPSHASSFNLNADGSFDYTPASDFNGQDTFTYKADDGAAVNNLSNTATVTITVNAVNDAPVVTATSSSLSYTEDDAATAIDSGLTVTDVDSTNLTGATVSITSNFASSEDVLSFSNQFNITGNYNSGTGVLTLSGTDTVAHYQTALRSVKYQNTSNTPSTATRTVTFTVNDGASANNTASDTRDITVNAVNDAPTLDNSGSPALSAISEDATTNNGTAVSAIIAALGGTKIQDADSGAVQGLAVIGVDNTNGTWQFSTNNGGGWTAFGSPSGSAARLLAADANTRIRFVPGANFNGTVNPGLTFRAWDQTAGTNGSTADTTTNGGTAAFSAATETASITVNAVADTPSISPTTTNEDTQSSTGLVIARNAADGSEVQYFKITNIQNGKLFKNNGTTQINSGDFIAVSDAANNGGAGLKFTPDTDFNDSIGTASFDAQASLSNSDAGLGGSTVTATIHVTAVNDAPVLTASVGTTSFVEGNNVASTPVVVDSSLSASDVDSTTFASATVSITNNFHSGEDVLAFDNNNAASFGNIQVDSYTSGVLSLSSPGATATIAQWRNALRAVTYTNSSDTPNTSTRTISFRADDGAAANHLSTAVTKNVSVTATNDAPVVTATSSSLSYTEDDAATAIDSGLTVTDVDSTNLTGATVSITSNFASSEDVLSFSNQFNITGNYNSGTGVLTLSGTDTVAHYQTALRSVKYQNTSNTPSTATRTVTFTVNDGASANNTASDTRSITVGNNNDAPVNTVPGGQTVNEDTDLVFNSANSNAISVADADAGSADLTVTLTVSHGTLTLATTAGLTSSSGNGTASVTLAGTQTKLNTALNGLKYRGDADYNGGDSLKIVTDDGGSTGTGGAKSDTDSVSITVNAVNDAPVNTVPGALNIAQGTVLTFTGGNQISVADVDAGANAVKLTLTATNGTLTLSGTTGLSFTTGDGTADATMVFTGNLTNVNAALDGMKFTPTNGFNGAASVQIVSNDQGKTGSGGAKTDTDTVGITVDPLAAIYINEVLFNPDATAKNEYIELRGTPDSTIPAGTYFVVINGNTSLGNLGDVQTIINLSGLKFGSNGFLVLLQKDNTYTTKAGANVVTSTTTGFGGLPGGIWSADFGANEIGDESVTFMLVQTGAAPTLSDDIDSNDDGTPNGSVFAGWNVRDSVGMVGGSGSPLDRGYGAINYVTGGGGSTGTLVTVSFVTAYLGRIGDSTGSTTADWVASASLGGAAPNFTLGNSSNTEPSNFAGKALDHIGASNFVNLAPTNSVPGAQAMNEDTTLTFNAANSNLISVDDPDVNAADLKITLTATNGVVSLNGTSGLSFTAGDGTADAQMTFTGTKANINARLNGLTFTPTAQFFGAASLEIKTDDQGHTGVGGAKTDTDTVSITVNGINDPPSFTKGANQTVNEDAGAQTVSGWATNISPGPGETGQALAFNVSLFGKTGNIAFSSGPAIDPTTGDLTYTASANTNGTATFNVTLSDNGSSAPPNNNTSGVQQFTITVNAVNDAPSFQIASNPPAVNEDAGAQTVNSFTSSFKPGPASATDEIGQTPVGYTVTQTGTTGNLSFSSGPSINSAGTLTYTPTSNTSGTATFDAVVTDSGSGIAPNVNKSAPVSFTITVTGENDAPVLDNTGNMSLDAINEDLAAASNTGTLVSDIVASAGGDRITDVDAGAVEGIAVTGVDNTNGTWQFSINNGGSWTPFGSPSATIARLLAGNATTRVRFVPGANFNGTVNPGLTFRAWDQTAGTNGSTADTTTNGGTAAFSAATETASITVNPVNDAPTANNDTLSDVAEDSGQRAIPFSALTGNDSTGPANEGGQHLIVKTVGSAVGGTVQISGSNVLFTPTANYHGPASFKYTVEDDGTPPLASAAAATASFNVTAVADTPSVTNATTLEDHQTTSGLVITRNAADGAEVLNFKITGITGGTLFQHNGTTQINNNDFITVAQGAAGLRFTPTPDSNAGGSFKVQASLSASDAGLGGGLATATITVNAVNDAPTLNSIGDLTINEDAPLQTVNLTGISAGGGESQTLVITATSSNTGVIPDPTVAYTSPNASGKLTFKPVANQSGSALITVKVKDNGGTAGGGVDTSSQTFTVTVNAVNDAPTNTVPGAQSTVRNSSLVFSAANSNLIAVADVDAGTNPVQVTLTATNGKITLSGTSGLSFTVGDGTADAAMKFTGTMTNINNALNGLTFVPTPGFDGAASLQITTNDQGNSGSGGALSDTDTISITVLKGGTLAFSSATYTVGEAGGTATITVKRTNGTNGTTKVDYATSDGTATAGSDYTATSGTLTFNNGETTKTFTVHVTNDQLDEANETVNLTLSNVTGSGALGSPSTAVLTITDNDSQASLSINDVSVAEGNSGTVNAAFTVTLSAQSGQAVTVNFATSDGTATAPSDYHAQSGVLTFAPGETTKTIKVLVNGDELAEPDETFTVNLSGATNAAISDSQGLGTITSDDTPLVEFSASTYNVNENDLRATITVNRLGDVSKPASVDYATSDLSGLNNCDQVTGHASSRCDYATSVGTVRFAAGEASKNILIPVVNDVYVEGPEVFTITLSNPTGGAELGSPAVATVTITDDDNSGQPNPIDTDAFFVRQLYIDILGREPEPQGLQAWLDILHNSSGQCHVPTDCDRIAVAIGFIKSPEFSDRGYFIFRFYKAALGRDPHYSEFIPDMARVSGFLSSQNLSDNKEAFVTEFMSRSEFKTLYDPTIGSPSAYVDKLLQTVGLPNHPSRNTWISGLTNGTLTRAQVLRQLVESDEVSTKFYNYALIFMHYFGFLRRDPDASFQHWVDVFNHSNDYRTIVNGFINSPEYRLRFGP